MEGRSTNYGSKPTEVYESMKGEFDGYSKWSNEVRRGESAILIESTIPVGMGRDMGERGNVRRQTDGGNLREISEGKRLSVEVDTPLDIAGEYVDIYNSNIIRSITK